MWIPQLNRNNLLHKLQLTTIHFSRASFFMQLTWLASRTSFFLSHRGSHFLQRHTSSFVEPVI